MNQIGGSVSCFDSASRPCYLSIEGSFLRCTGLEADCAFDLSKCVVDNGSSACTLDIYDGKTITTLRCEDAACRDKLIRDIELASAIASPSPLKVVKSDARSVESDFSTLHLDSRHILNSEGSDCSDMVSRKESHFCESCHNLRRNLDMVLFPLLGP